MKARLAVAAFALTAAAAASGAELATAAAGRAGHAGVDYASLVRGAAPTLAAWADLRRPAFRGFVATRRAETAAFASAMTPADRQRLDSVDFRRDVVIGAFRRFPSGSYTFEITGIERRNGAFALSAAVGRPPGGLASVFTAYDVVVVRRSALRRPIPRRAALARVVTRDLAGVAAGS